MKVEKNEILRYLRTENDEKISAVIDELLAVISDLIKPKSIIAPFIVEKTDKGYLLSDTNILFSGKLIEKTLDKARKIYLFAATLTLESERLMAKYYSTDMSKAVILDACLTAYIEAYCDDIENDIIGKERAQGMNTTPRISCGYGDFRLDYQRDIIDLLGAEKNLGIKLNTSNMFVPNKTVTALIAVKCERTKKIKGCGSCNFDCSFRK